MLEEIAEYSGKRKLSEIQRFLCICAGVDKDVLKQCPTEWNKYTGIGATILFTGVLASLSGGYALYTVFRNGDLNTTDTSALLPAFLFGILWGLIIFNLDRFIVSTFRKSEEDIWWKKYGKELLQASPRIILAIIIAIVISKPIEIKIFESRLAEQIQKNEIASKKNNATEFTNIYGIPDKKGQVLNLDTTLNKLHTELATDPQNVKDLINNDLAQANATLTRINNINNPKINQHRQNITSIRNNQNYKRPVYDSDGTTIVRYDLTKEANDKIQNENSAIGVLNREINSQQAVVNKINNQISEARKEYKLQKQKEIREKQQEKTEAEAKLKDAIAISETKTEEANKTSEKAFTNNFITQIEALGDLTDTDSTMWWTSLMIMLLFLTIELAPILTKLITKRGSYDEILDRTEYELMVKQKEIISRINSEINELLIKAEEVAKLRGEMFVQAHKIKLDAELNNNKIITDDIAKKQQELALRAIDKWYKEEQEKMETSSASTSIITKTT
ncbi:MAG: DUF4407 domain-containing protein [Candidatus Symbiothrix sp.]|jgi:hypothetical protein|nr:DUF4407 domain-containing protein [Candidatus Symbiothrix sp.]